MGGGERGKWVMGIEVGTFWSEHWVMNHRNLPPKPRAHCIQRMSANLTINYTKKIVTKYKIKPRIIP